MSLFLGPRIVSLHVLRDACIEREQPPDEVDEPYILKHDIPPVIGSHGFKFGFFITTKRLSRLGNNTTCGRNIQTKLE